MVSWLTKKHAMGMNLITLTPMMCGGIIPTKTGMIAEFEFTVNAKQHQKPLLECVLPMIPYLSLEKWQDLIHKGLVRRNGVVVEHAETVSEGDVIAYVVPDHSEDEVNTRWRWLWNDADIAVIAKPENLPVNRTTRNVYNTLIQLLRRESPWPDAHLLHRLDAETSGLLLVGRNNDVAKQRQANLNQWLHTKEYLAVVKGAPSWRHMSLSAPLKERSDSDIRSKMYVQHDGKVSETELEVLSVGKGASLILCRLKSGRKHQIRAHLAHLGLPIIGDKMYSMDGQYYLKRVSQHYLSAGDYEALESDHHLLHCWRLGWQWNGQKQVVVDDHIPANMKRVCDHYGVSLASVMDGLDQHQHCALPFHFHE